MGYYMKKFIILVLFLNLNAAYASEDIFFANIPQNITTTQAMAAVEKAAVRRKWTSTELPNNKFFLIFIVIQLRLCL